MKKSNRVIASLALAALFFAGACDDGSQRQEDARSAINDQQEAINSGLNRQLDSQQVPTFDYSEERQTLIDVLTIRAEGSIGTTSFYLEGVGLVGWCPSSGAPVPSTYQLTPPDQYIDLSGDESRTKYPSALAEPTGVFPGDSTATWVVCLDDAGNPFGVYHEGPVNSVIGVVSGLDPSLRYTVDELTYEFTPIADPEAAGLGGG
jgi:hypothetical protein